jgi:hypothetical protein
MVPDVFGNVFVSMHSQWHAAAHCVESAFGDRMGRLYWQSIFVKIQEDVAGRGKCLRVRNALVIPKTANAVGFSGDTNSSELHMYTPTESLFLDLYNSLR